MSKEKVFCFHKSFMEGFELINKGFPSMEYYNNAWLKHCYKNSLFLERDFLEGNPCFKQIIPYVVIMDPNEEKLFSYSRSGSESRLKDLYSIGIGGHINPCDFRNDLDETIYQATKRELEEELTEPYCVPINKNSLHVQGLIYLDDSNAVNQDHIGVVLKLIAYSAEDLKMNSEGKDSAWRTVEDLKKVRLEPWSKIALEIIGK